MVSYGSRTMTGVIMKVSANDMMVSDTDKKLPKSVRKVLYGFMKMFLVLVSCH